MVDPRPSRPDWEGFEFLKEAFQYSPTTQIEGWRLHQRRCSRTRGIESRYARIDNDTPSFAAITLVAPGVRFSAFAILVTPDLALAIVFIVLISSFVHARRTTFFAFAILTPFRATTSDGQMHEHCCKNVEGWR